MFDFLVIAGGAVALWLAAVLLNRRGLRRYDRTGDPQEGVVIFVEPCRWLWIIWGFTAFCRGLRGGGCNSRVYLFRWAGVDGAALAFPDLIRRRRLERKAARLIRFIQTCAAEHPGCSLHVVGYSSGTFVAAEAARFTPPPARIGQVLLLASSLSPGYPLERVCKRVEGVHAFGSPLDLVVVLGPAIFGSNDRRWGPAAGAVGFRTRDPRLVAHRWHPADVLLGYFGDHFTVVSSRFVAARIAPLLCESRAKSLQSVT